MGQEHTMQVQQVIEFNVPIHKIDQRVVKALTETTLGYIDLSNKSAKFQARAYGGSFI